MVAVRSVIYPILMGMAFGGMGVGIAAEPESAPIFVSVPYDPELEAPVPTETFVLEGSEEHPSSVEEPSAPELELAPVTEGDLDIPVADTVPLPELPVSDELENSHNPPPVADLDLLPPPTSGLGLPAELADFEVLFTPIISVSEVGVRVRWACDKKTELTEAAENLARAPMFEMTNRNFDTWRTHTKSLKKLMGSVKSNCAFGADGESAVNQELEKAFDAWTTLKESRG